MVIGVQEGVVCSPEGALRRFGEHRRVALLPEGYPERSRGAGRGGFAHGKGSWMWAMEGWELARESCRRTREALPSEGIAGIKAVFCCRGLKEVSIFCILALI